MMQIHRTVAALTLAVLAASCARSQKVEPAPLTVLAFAQAKALMLECRYAEAEALAAAHVANATGTDQALFLMLLGNVAEHRGDIHTAIARYTEATALDSVPIEAFRLLGHAQTRNRQFKDGAAALLRFLPVQTKELRRTPASLDLAALAVATAELGDIGGARSLVQLALKHVDGADPLLLDLARRLEAPGAAPGQFWTLAYGDERALHAMTVDRPATVVVRRAPAYPRAAVQRGLEGTVMLHLRIAADGRLDDVRVAKSEPAGVFDSVALAAVREWRFRPATRHCRPVASESLQQIDFRIQRRAG